ncbi:hypothetical protein ACFYZI_40925 [Streptomyces griseorubiginosus]|uniref:hypothetical protein n=1 Tax=Streptomyces griseorubiginosus TaxID=67304 RepID=UPI0036C6299D
MVALISLVAGLIPHEDSKPNKTTETTTGTPVTANPTEKNIPPAPQPNPTGSASPKPTLESLSPGVQRHEQVVIAWDHGIVLDSERADYPDWDYSENILHSDFGTLTDGTIYSPEYQLVPATPDKLDCQKPGFKNGMIEGKDVIEGMVLCVKSRDAGKYARVTVVHVDKPNKSTTFDILVWK